MRESELESMLCKHIEARGGWQCKLAGVGGKGLPDRLVSMPALGLFFVELKAPTGKLSEAQRRKHVELIRSGSRVFVVDGPDHWLFRI